MDKKPIAAILFVISAFCQLERSRRAGSIWLEKRFYHLPSRNNSERSKIILWTCFFINSSLQDSCWEPLGPPMKRKSDPTRRKSTSWHWGNKPARAACPPPLYLVTSCLLAVCLRGSIFSLSPVAFGFTAGRWYLLGSDSLDAGPYPCL